MDEEQIYAVGDGPVIISIGIPLGSPLCEEDKEESKAVRSFNSPQYRRSFSGVAHDVLCSSWVRFIFVILDLVLSLAIIYRTILFQNTPGLDTEQQHELTLIGIKQIASLQAEMVVKMILWNRFQDRKPREGNKRSFALCYWYGYMLLSFSIQLLVFLEVLKQISWLTM